MQSVARLTADCKFESHFSHITLVDSNRIQRSKSEKNEKPYRGSSHGPADSLASHLYYCFPHFDYRIRRNYRTYSYKRLVKQFNGLQITPSVLLVYFFIKAYVVGTHLNCIDLSMQFKWVPTIYAFIKNKSEKKSQKKCFAGLFFFFFFILSEPLVDRYIVYHKCSQ